MNLIDENQAEQACLSWFGELGYTYAFGPDLAQGLSAGALLPRLMSGRLRISSKVEAVG